MHSVEHIFEQLTGINPAYCEPPLTELYMSEAIHAKREEMKNKVACASGPASGKNKEISQSDEPIFILLASEQFIDNPKLLVIETMAQNNEKILSHKSLIGKRTCDGQWACAFLPEKLDPDVDSVGPLLEPQEWRDVNAVPGLGDYIQRNFDPSFEPKHAPQTTLLCQTETLWQRSIANGTTQHDAFKTDDVTL